MSNKSRSTWEVEEYEIIQIIPNTGIMAVYAMEDAGNPGLYILEASHLDFVAVAKVTTTCFEKIGKGTPRIIEESSINEIVGVQLNGSGYFDICNEVGNFSGYYKEGSDINEVTWHLSAEYPLSSRELNKKAMS